MTYEIAHISENVVHSSMKTRRKWSRYSNKTFYLFISPWIIGFLLLTVIPLFYALMMSFTNFDGISPHWHWIGLANYSELFRDPDTWYSLSRTLLYTVLAVPLTIAGGLGLALLMNMRLRVVGLFRTLFYLPTVVPIVAAAITWRLIFGRDTGPLNALLGHSFDWLGDPMAFGALLILALWGMGSGMVLSLAGLQGIPQELREAAIVDGANPWQMFRSVTLPMLSPVLFFQVVTGVIAALQVLVQPLLLATAGFGQDSSGLSELPRSNYLYMVHVYAQFFQNQRFGYGSALLWILFLFVLVITILVFRSGSLWVYYEVDQSE